MDEQIADPDFRDVLTRIGVWTDRGQPEGAEMDAIFGSRPNDTTLKQVLVFYEEQIRTELIGLSKRETNKRRGPPRLAIDRFIAFVGHDPVANKITHAFIMRHRTDRAMELLIGGDEPIAQIAVACGFADQAHFSRIFSRRAGLPPGTWRHLKRATTPDFSA